MSKTYPSIRADKRNTAHADTKDFCYFAKEGDSIMVTAWTNGEGVDIDFIRLDSTRGDLRLQLSYGEIKAITTLTKLVDK